MGVKELDSENTIYQGEYEYGINTKRMVWIWIRTYWDISMT